MEYFDLICNIIVAMLGIFGVSLFLFVVIRDNFFKKDNENKSNNITDGSGSYEDLW
jgi:hypothetical protein